MEGKGGLGDTRLAVVVAVFSFMFFFMCFVWSFGFGKCENSVTEILYVLSRKYKKWDESPGPVYRVIEGVPNLTLSVNPKPSILISYQSNTAVTEPQNGKE